LRRFEQHQYLVGPMIQTGDDPLFVTWQSKHAFCIK